MTVTLDRPVDGLVSFHYFRNTDLTDLARGFRLIGDCGAYSAWSQGKPIDREELWAWQEKWRPRLMWTASLDVAFNAEASWDNWRSRPATLPDLVPTIHYGDPPEYLDRYVDGGADLIGLGGMVPYKSQPARLMRWCLSVFRYARTHHPHVRFHGWGVTHPTLLQNLPWWSVDSSGFGSGYRYGLIPLWDPVACKVARVEADGRDAARQRRLLADQYGLEWRDVLVSGPENRATIIAIGVRTAQLMGKWLQKRHHVTPPASLAHTNLIGPRIHFADATTGNYAAIMEEAMLV